MIKEITILCDGGLCNRLNSLVVGFLIADYYQLKSVISWPVNNWCELSSSNIFEDNHFFDFNAQSIDELKYSAEETILVAHERQNFKINIDLQPNKLNSFAELISCIDESRKQSIIYYNSTIPKYITNEMINRALGSINFLKKYNDLADDFMLQENLITDKYWSLHMRGTDFGHTKMYFLKWKLISYFLTGNIFLCTDDDSVVDMFATIKKLKIRKNISRVEKFKSNLHWNDQIQDENNRIFNFNVHRTSMTVSDAIVDLILLSRGKIILTSDSTFLKFAVLMQNFRRFNELLQRY